MASLVFILLCLLNLVFLLKQSLSLFRDLGVLAFSFHVQCENWILSTRQVHSVSFFFSKQVLKHRTM